MHFIILRYYKSKWNLYCFSC